VQANGKGRISIVAKSFLDTNILIYQLDARDPVKQERCRGIVKALVSSHEAVISTQILQEFYVACTTKLKVKPILVKGIMHGFENMEVVTIGAELISEAIDTSLQYQLSFWDALVVVAAESAKCKYLLTEDLNEGQIVRKVRIQNPLKVNE
jgi:predicted nucleic acid-binding protein